MPSMLGHAGEMEMGRRMIQVEKHGNRYPKYPYIRCVCKLCGCQFTFDHLDTYRLNCCGDVYEVINCPECGYPIDEIQWDI